MKKAILFALLCSLQFTTMAGNKIKFYFNHPVDNSVSTGVNAVYLNFCMADTLVNYINRAKYTIDVAVYNFSTGSYASVSTAINNAYSRGVKVRWIFDSSSSNTALAGLNPLINTLGSPTTSSYGIMHDKFMIIDAYSANPSDAIVWTGATNWGYSQFNTDYNNTVIFQDSALAHAFTGEFNQMWGGAGIAPVLSNSKFGPKKKDLGRHSFTIEGHLVELYFSPSDNTNSKIQNAISSANTDVYFGMYAFTDNTDASLINSKYSGGVYAAGIVDNFSTTYTSYSMLSTALAGNLKVYTSGGLYHNKFLIVDPSDKCSDPQVLTGSHNWSFSADTKNDENTVIIHSDTAANIYYQSFRADFAALGGALTKVTGCPLLSEMSGNEETGVEIFPNPTSGDLSVSYQLPSADNVSIIISNSLGQKVASFANEQMQPAGMHLATFSIDAPGLYFVHFISGNTHLIRKAIVQK